MGVFKVLTNIYNYDIIKARRTVGWVAFFIVKSAYLCYDSATP